MPAVAPLTPGYRSTPYWWDDVELPGADPGPLPSDADVAVVGGGYTGLAAALELARAGRHVVVFDRGGVGAGASSRNGGMAHPGGMLSLAQILALPGGRALWEETVAAFEALAPLCEELGADCRFERTGHLELAHHHRAAAHLRAVAVAYAESGEEARYLGRDELGDEIGSERFVAGLLVARSGGLHPAALAAGLARGAAAAGAELHGATAVRAITGRRPHFVVDTVRGTVRCGEVVVATNGSTGRRPEPWLGRRVLGIGSFIIATEPIPPGLAAELSPRGRMFFDTRNLLHYWRLAPDRRRLLFGGRTSLAPTTVEQARDRLYAAMVGIHPQLAGCRIERAWGGEVALTADRVPHAGRHGDDGVVYAMGYCGSGVALATHLGRAIGCWVAGTGPPPAFTGRPWHRVPAPARVPWLLTVGGWWYRARDVFGV